ncbi:hypothetical protein EYF80_040446 [Liparis tanakae]|uniref:Uncharacterized protein n=1 Tax=Liparis tanakae TaxID=230148 RepID=A0A4Z2G710_9TELE|nr:hypothetical protein EYF80_040446 [Liparis tanakae]
MAPVTGETGGRLSLGSDVIHRCARRYFYRPGTLEDGWRLPPVVLTEQDCVWRPHLLSRSMIGCGVDCRQIHFEGRYFSAAPIHHLLASGALWLGVDPVDLPLCVRGDGP